MNLTICNHLIHRNFITRISLNVSHNILAAIVDSSDTVAFYHLQSSNRIVEIFQGTSRPSGKKTTLAWSPDGQYLALGASILELWKFDGRKMSPVKNFSDDFIDIKIIAWASDSLTLAYAGLSKKNTVKVRNIENGSVSQIYIPVTISAISFDPFGKYLLILASSNILNIYKTGSLNKISQIPLSPDTDPFQSINTVKQNRFMDWSPDYNYVVCPSLDDSKISLAIGLSRSSNFKINNVFTGHVSPISCSRFNPLLYQWQQKITSILALGDSEGVISIWRICNQTPSAPIFVSNTVPESQAVIQDMQWSHNGTVLIVNIMRRYINVLTFDKKCFGKELTLEQKTSVIQANFGVKSVIDFQRKQIEIFSIASINKNQIIQAQKTQPKETFSTLQEPKIHQSQQVLVSAPENSVDLKTNQEKSQPQQSLLANFSEKAQYVRVKQQIVTKGKDNRKKIQPAMLVRKQQAENNLKSSGPTSSYFNIANFYEPLNLKPLTLQLKNLKLPFQGFLQIKRIQTHTIIYRFENKDNQKIITNQKVFPGSIDFLKISRGFIYVFTQSCLHIYDHALETYELPYRLGQVHRLAFNDIGDIYFISTKGIIRGFNHLKRICYTPTPVPLQSLISQQKNNNTDSQAKNDQKTQQIQNILQSFTVQKDHNIYLSLSKIKGRYFFDRQTDSWVSLQFTEGLLQKGHSLQIGKQETQLIQQFFRSVSIGVRPQQIKNQRQGEKNIFQNNIQLYETNMIYYKKHNPNVQLYHFNLFNLIRELKNKNQVKKLRTIIQKYFIDTESATYQNDPVIRQKIKQLGGNVITQFVHFGQL